MPGALDLSCSPEATHKRRAPILRPAMAVCVPFAAGWLETNSSVRKIHHIEQGCIPISTNIRGVMEMRAPNVSYPIIQAEEGVVTTTVDHAFVRQPVRGLNQTEIQAIDAVWEVEICDF